MIIPLLVIGFVLLALSLFAIYNFFSVGVKIPKILFAVPVVAAVMIILGFVLGGKSKFTNISEEEKLN